jgi:flagellar protein FliL
MSDDLLEPTKSKKKRSAGFLPALLVALLAGGAAGGGAGWLAADLRGAAPGTAAGGDAPAEADAPEPDWALFGIDNLVVNPAGTQGRRFLIVSLAVEVEPDSALPRASGAEARIRDGILRALGARTIEELADPDRRSELESMVRAAVVDVTDDRSVGRVYFSQFVLQ